MAVTNRIWAAVGASAAAQVAPASPKPAARRSRAKTTRTAQPVAAPSDEVSASIAENAETEIAAGDDDTTRAASGDN